MTNDEKSVAIVERFIRPSADYPDGSYIQIVNGEVTIATGKYATIYPHKPSYQLHGESPFVMVDTSEWAKLPWRDIHSPADPK